MDPSGISSHCNVKTCSLCPGDTEYYCHICQQDMCLQCKEEHVINLDTLNHNVTIYRQKYNHPLKKETCFSHRKCYYNKYCESCEIPVCDSCSEHTPHIFPFIARFLSNENEYHKIIDIKSAYLKKRRKHQQLICDIRSNAIYSRTVMLAGLYTDINDDSENYHRKFDLCQHQMVEKGQKLKDFFDTEKEYTVPCEKEKHNARNFLQMLKMTRHISKIEKYVDRYEQSISKPVEFLKFIKRSINPLNQDEPHIIKYSFFFNFEINTGFLIKLLCSIKTTETSRRQAGNEQMLKRSPFANLRQTFKMSGMKSFYHISLVSPYRIWASGYNKPVKMKIMLKSTSDKTLHIVKNSCTLGRGCHTVNRENDLIYIDNKRNIKKLSGDMKTKNTLIYWQEKEWEPLCLYCSPITGDILIGMDRNDTDRCRVARFDRNGLLIRTIEKKNTGHSIYQDPWFITENTNEDVVVSDRCAVVVTDRCGKHRFSYKGPPSNWQKEYPLNFSPKGICTDPLSNILVCSNTEVQIIDRDGHFLLYLLEKTIGLGSPQSLAYDVNTHLLYVGLSAFTFNTISIYSYIERHGVLTDTEQEKENKKDQIGEIGT